MQMLLVAALATLCALSAPCRTLAHPYITHLGPKSRQFWEMAALRSQQPYLLGANRWGDLLAPAGREIGFCPYKAVHEFIEVQEGGRVHRHKVTRLLCASESRAQDGCVPIFEERGWLGVNGDGEVHAGCVYIDPHRYSKMSPNL